MTCLMPLKNEEEYGGNRSHERDERGSVSLPSDEQAEKQNSMYELFTGFRGAGGAVTIMMSPRKLGSSPEVIGFYAIMQLLQATVLSS